MTAHEPLWLQFGPMGDVESVSNEPIEDHSEWHRVTPDTIAKSDDFVTLPRAEVEALMEAADRLEQMVLFSLPRNKTSKYAAPCRAVNNALAALQERMK